MKIAYKYGPCSGDCGRDHVLIVQKSLGLCPVCNQKRLTKRYQERRRQRVSAGEKADKVKLQSFYKEVWAREPHQCFETDEPLYTYHSWHVHHVLHKEDYPELAFNHDICVLLSLEQHSRWHGLAPSDRAERMPRTWQRYLDLCEKYHLTP